MQVTVEENPTRDIQTRPEIRSYDSGEECSLDHWLDVYDRVQEELIDEPERARTPWT